MAKRFVVLAFLHVLLIFPRAFNQEIQRRISRYNVEDGLNQSSVTYITQDIYGYIWISTGNGLNCFDGNKFTGYFPPAGPKSTYRANRFRKVIGDETGNLWIGSDEGLFYLDRATDRVTIPFPEIDKLNGGYCYPVFLTNDTIHVAVADTAVLSIHIRDHQYRTIGLKMFLYQIITPARNQSEIIGLSSPGGISSFRPVNGLLITDYLPQPELSDISGADKLNDSMFLFVGVHDFYTADFYNGTVRQVHPSGIPENLRKSYFRSVGVMRSGDIWVGTNNNGVIILDSLLNFKGRLGKMNHHPDDRPDLKNITTIFEDGMANVWIGTDGSGLARIAEGRDFFSIVNESSYGREVLCSDFSRCFYQDEGEVLWIGSNNEGLTRWDRKSDEFFCVRISDYFSPLSPNNVYSICPVDQDRFLLGTACGIWEFDKNTFRSQPIAEMFRDNEARKTGAIIEMGKKSYFALLQKKCFVISERDYNWLFDTIPLPPTASIDEIYRSQANENYGFSIEGIYLLSGDSCRFFPYVYQNSRMLFKVNSFVGMKSGICFAATDKGLIRMDISGNIYKIYGIGEGLPNTFLYELMPDKKERLWISSNKGLSLFDPASEIFENFSLGDGLQSYEFNSGAAYMTPNGEMFFGGINGFNYFFPDSLIVSEASLNTVISGIKVNDQVYQPDSAVMAKKLLSLEYELNTVTFEFNAIDFVNLDNIEYEYMLEGYDKGWIHAGISNLVRYSRIPPGNYLFRARALRHPGKTAGKEAAITLVIKRPFWLQAWFVILSAVFLMALAVLGIYYLSTQKLRIKLAAFRRKEEIYRIRRRISSDLHDDIGSGLSKLAMLSDLAVQNASHDEETKEHLKKVSSRARALIDQLRVIVWTLNPQYDQLENLIAYIHQQAGDFLDSTGMIVNFSMPDKVPAVSINPEFKRNIHYLVMESLNNAVKHANASEIVINISVENSSLEINLMDNGKGFDPTKSKGSGNGLHFMQKRIDEIGGRLEILTEEGSGTTIRFSAPF